MELALVTISNIIIIEEHFDGSVQERHNSIANTLELCLSCTNPSISFWVSFVTQIPN